MAYDYGSVMAEGNWPEGWEQMLSSIDRQDVYSQPDGNYGLETEPHVTVLYGLHDEVHGDLVCRVCQGLEKPLEIDVQGASSFKKEDYDVLKLDVESDMLRKMNKAFRAFPHTNDYDEYKPHMTLAYLNKGTADKYEKDVSSLAPDSITLPRMRFQPSGSSNPIKFSL